MNRAVAASFAFLFVAVVAACGSKTNKSICVQQPPPAACSTMCDPNGANTCPLGFFCNSSGKCDAECTVGGGQCGSNAICTTDGHCMSTSGGPDADCPAVHFTPMKTTPSIEIVFDRSGSMDTDFGGGLTRFQAMQQGLFDPTNGAVVKTQADVYFGESMFAGDQTPCLKPITTPRALNNANALATLTMNNPPAGGSTPTADAIDQTVTDFGTNPPPSGSPPIILLATDGEPNSCGGGGGNGPSITSAKNAYTAGIRLFILGLAGVANQYLQDMANAGTGQPTGQAPGCTGCSPYYTADSPASLATALDSIINGVLSCDLTLTGMIDPTQASQGTVTLNGVQLMYGTDWTLDPNGMVIHLTGSACTTLQTSTNPTVDAAFPCGSVIQ